MDYSEGTGRARTGNFLMQYYKKLYLLRHGDTGKTGCFIGATDVSITEQAEIELRRMRHDIARIGFTKILCSPLSRCRQTALNLELEKIVEIEDRLREIDFGRWEGLSYPEVVERFPDELRQWQEKPVSFTFPQGESIPAFRQRVREMTGLLKECEEERVLLITHAGVIRYLICDLLNMASEEAIKFRIQPARVTSLDLYSEGAVLTGLNIIL